MPRFTSFDPNAEALGSILLSYVHCINNENLYPFLEKYGLIDIQPDQWYPLQKWLDALGDLAEVESRGQARFDFVAVGLKVAETTVLPPEFGLLPFSEIIRRWNDAYSLWHRGNAGTMYTEEVGENHLRIISCLPYPDDIGYGVMWGVARRFLPRTSRFSVYYEEGHQHHDQGGDTTIVHIKWGAEPPR